MVYGIPRTIGTPIIGMSTIDYQRAMQMFLDAGYYPSISEWLMEEIFISSPILDLNFKNVRFASYIDGFAAKEAKAKIDKMKEGMHNARGNFQKI